MADALNNYAPDGSTRVTVVNAESPIELTGDLGIPQLDDIVTATEATQAAAEDLLAITGTDADSSATVTIIGLLTRIAEGVEALA